MNNENINLPGKLLRQSTIKVIAPFVAKETSEPIDNSKTKRKRVQAKRGGT